MNYIALNQNILGKNAVFGSGFKEGEESDPFKTDQGFKLYFNGVHVLPEIEIEALNERILLGQIHHPHAMLGPPDWAGKITYQFFTGNDAYLIAVELELEDVEDNTAVEILAQSMRQDIPEEVVDDDGVKVYLAIEMLKIHFEKLFLGYESIEELTRDDWIFEGEYLLDIMKIYFEKKESQ